jgi:uncharacterized protein (DUF2249 family)
VIEGGDRVADVIARDPRLIEVFVAVAPAFARLRNPALRKVMARLVTVQQAARMAGVETDELLERLNGGAGQREDTEKTMEGMVREVDVEREPGLDGPAGLPEELAGVDPSRLVDLDVRADLRSGIEPFSRIMAARRDVPANGVLRLRAIFEPVPLYAVMGKQGFRHWTEQLGEEDWRVWFYREAEDGTAEGVESEPASEPAGCGGCGESDPAVVLDVRGLEPPEPMLRTLAALETLERGQTLVQLNVKEPRFLLPQLEERGFVYEVREQEPGLVRIFIRHAKGA